MWLHITRTESCHGAGMALNLLLCTFCCADIDECAAPDNGGCHANAVCTNTVGSRICSCKAGYSGDGMSCTGMLVACVCACVVGAWLYFLPQRILEGYAPFKDSHHPL